MLFFLPETSYKSWFALKRKHDLLNVVVFSKVYLFSLSKKLQRSILIYFFLLCILFLKRQGSTSHSNVSFLFDHPQQKLYNPKQSPRQARAAITTPVVTILSLFRLTAQLELISLPPVLNFHSSLFCSDAAFFPSVFFFHFHNSKTDTKLKAFPFLLHYISLLLSLTRLVYLSESFFWRSRWWMLALFNVNHIICKRN